jgi:hypothetical protein
MSDYLIAYAIPQLIVIVAIYLNGIREFYGWDWMFVSNKEMWRRHKLREANVK